MQIDGPLAVQSDAVPELSVESPHAVRDIFATVMESSNRSSYHGPGETRRRNILYADHPGGSDIVGRGHRWSDFAATWWRMEARLRCRKRGHGSSGSGSYGNDSALNAILMPW